MTETATAASPATASGPGQAATNAQQGAPQQGQPPVQSGGGPAPVPGQTQQGETTGSAPQTGTPPATVQPAAVVTAPERYELRLPEAGPLDQSDIDAVAALAKTHAWTNEQAQATLDEMASSLTAQSTRFRSELDADPEVGGARLEAAQLQAQRVLDRFLPANTEQGQRLRSTLNKTGYGNFLPFVTLLARLGQAMGEDQPHSGGSSRAFSPPTRSQADRLFGDAQGIRPAT